MGRLFSKRRGLALSGAQRGKKARETAKRFSRPVAQLPSQSRLPPCQLPQRGSQVCAPPKACAKPSLASPFGGGAQWAPFSADRAGRRECPPKEGGEGQPQVAPGLERGKGSSIEKSQVLCGFQNLTQGSRVPHSCPCFPALLTLGASLKTQVLCGFQPLLTLWNIQVDPMPARGGFPPLSLLQLMGKCL